MTSAESLIEAIHDEDRQLRAVLQECPARLLEGDLGESALNPKEVLGHLAYWDELALDFFKTRVARAAAREENSGRRIAEPVYPVNFEERSREELARIRAESFAVVLRRYGEATATLIAFLNDQWEHLSQAERNDFRIPLKHRRHHRLLLIGALQNAGCTISIQQKAEEA